jgi:hypothetical protein
MFAQRYQKRIDMKKTVQKEQRPIYYDSIYFHMSQVKPGTKLVFCGRFQPKSTWIVLEIRSHYLGKVVGDIKVRKVNELRRIGDVVTLRNDNTGELIKRVFSYMASSAAWRLA